MPLIYRIPYLLRLLSSCSNQTRTLCIETNEEATLFLRKNEYSNNLGNYRKFRTVHSGAKSKMYEQKYFNYSFRCEKKYEVKFFKIGGGGCGKS